MFLFPRLRICGGWVCRIDRSAFGIYPSLAQTGNKRYTTEIIVDNLQLLGKKSDNPGGQGGYQAPAQPQYGQQQTYNQPAYNPQSAAQNAPAAAQNIMNDMPDDDLPF